MKISLLGTGLMGLPMAQRLIDAHHSLTAYNRTSSKLDPLQAAGATIAPSAAVAIAASNCIILMLTDAFAIRELLLCEASRSHLAGR
ncbi:MAG: NAD(P)-binding domain-containing protein, partial [Phormidesmis sp. CAN_BIN44]|nr:NAD(P)-binding domain-containing protein [Phormidesmis sp. CAN_BIN44]